MARRYDSAEAKRRILAACARLFLEQGYTNTTMTEILKTAGVSSGSFQNIFHTKDGVLVEFVNIMFSGQFGVVRELAASAPTPAHAYAVETALQLTLTEINENLRDIYIEAYTYSTTAEIIHRRMTDELRMAFEVYLPKFTDADFYEIELGTAGMMRSFMARPCDPYFTQERKTRRFLEMSLDVLHVPQKEKTEIIEYVSNIDLRTAAMQVMDALFSSLAIQFDLVKA